MPYITLVTYIVSKVFQTLWYSFIELKKVTCDPTLPKAKQVEQQKRKAAESGDTLLVPKRIKTTTTNGTDKADGSKVINLKKKVIVLGPVRNGIS